MLFAKKKPREKKAYDPARWKPVIRCSICTGEMAAGFKETATGRFEEVMLIRADRGLARVEKEYGVGHVAKAYCPRPAGTVRRNSPSARSAVLSSQAAVTPPVIRISL